MDICFKKRATERVDDFCAAPEKNSFHSAWGQAPERMPKDG